MDRLKVLLIKAPLYFCRFLKLGVSNAFVIDEAQLEFKMRTQTRLEKISTAISLFGMAMGFSVLGFLIVVNQHDGGASIPGGIFGILLGAAFLIAACLHLKRQIQGGFRLEEIPAEIVPEMRQATDNDQVYIKGHHQDPRSSGPDPHGKSSERDCRQPGLDFPHLQ